MSAVGATRGDCGVRPGSSGCARNLTTSAGLRSDPTCSTLFLRLLMTYPSSISALRLTMTSASLSARRLFDLAAFSSFRARLAARSSPVICLLGRSGSLTSSLVSSSGTGSSPDTAPNCAWIFSRISFSSCWLLSKERVTIFAPERLTRYSRDEKGRLRRSRVSVWFCETILAPTARLRAAPCMLGRIPETV